MYIVILQLLLVFPKSLNLNIPSTAACTKKTISSCLSLLLLKLKMPELELENQCDEDRDYSSLRSTSETRRIVLLTKLVRLPITRLSVRAVSFLALHETPAGYFFGTCLASKLCIRTIMQAHSTLRKPANTHHTHSKTKKVYVKHWWRNEWGKSGWHGILLPALCFILTLLNFSNMTRTWFLNLCTLSHPRSFLYLHNSEKRRVKEVLEINIYYL